MASVVLSHWHQRFEETQLSTLEFYEVLYKLIDDKKLPDVSLIRVTYTETGLFSARREYFRIQRNEYMFDICAAPFGRNFFISYWLTEASGRMVAIVSRIPFVGRALSRKLLKKTFYQQDTEIMFKESIQALLMDAIDSVSDSGKGLRKLAPGECKPQVDNTYRN